MTILKSALLAAALLASGQAFAQSFDRGPDPRAAGVDAALVQQSIVPFYKAERVATVPLRSHRIDGITVR